MWHGARRQLCRRGRGTTLTRRFGTSRTARSRRPRRARARAPCSSRGWARPNGRPSQALVRAGRPPPRPRVGAGPPVWRCGPRFGAACARGQGFRHLLAQEESGRARCRDEDGRRAKVCYAAGATPRPVAAARGAGRGDHTADEAGARNELGGVAPAAQRVAGSRVMQECARLVPARGRSARASGPPRPWPGERKAHRHGCGPRPLRSPRGASPRRCCHLQSPPHPRDCRCERGGRGDVEAGTVGEQTSPGGRQQRRRERRAPSGPPYRRARRQRASAEARSAKGPDDAPFQEFETGSGSSWGQRWCGIRPRIPDKQRRVYRGAPSRAPVECRAARARAGVERARRKRPVSRGRAGQRRGAGRGGGAFACQRPCR